MRIDELAGVSGPVVSGRLLFVSINMASLNHSDFRSMLEVQNRRNQRANADLERLGTLPLEDGDSRPGSLEG